jgi:hypothetical protein
MFKGVYDTNIKKKKQSIGLSQRKHVLPGCNCGERSMIHFSSIHIDRRGIILLT